MDSVVGPRPGECLGPVGTLLTTDQPLECQARVHDDEAIPERGPGHQERRRLQGSPPGGGTHSRLAEPFPAHPGPPGQVPRRPHRLASLSEEHGIRRTRQYGINNTRIAKNTAIHIAETYGNTKNTATRIAQNTAILQSILPASTTPVLRRIRQYGVNRPQGPAETRGKKPEEKTPGLAASAPETARRIGTNHAVQPRASLLQPENAPAIIPGRSHRIHALLFRPAFQPGRSGGTPAPPSNPAPGPPAG